MRVQACWINTLVDLLPTIWQHMWWMWKNEPFEGCMWEHTEAGKTEKHKSKGQSCK